ncbi:Mg-chelatase subunit ChlD [Leptolyngbya sp. 'hensonii']|uniref:VWA domain-containing protein n=1 Tax=Leptolyngbya sp. 'hensonii' TaxID=1922337 RepID=UPI00094F69F5|nr:VWA domain-containing protein [Leptolyngbya sp. 'hensonii']OLP18951.1 Mg-chelatase subunit ChlD [Leptolyngbya sp. 'hensonii']
MIPKFRRLTTRLAVALSVVLLAGCNEQNANQSQTQPTQTGFPVKILVGSALEDFCHQAAQKYNQQQPKLENGKSFYVECEARGSGDVVTTVITLAQQFKSGTLPADSPDFPTLVSVDGEIYQSQLIYQMNQLFPGQRYIPEITDSPLLANSPMVFMAQPDVAAGLRKLPDPFKALVTAKTHKEMESSSPPLTVHYVQTAPTRSNSGLQTLVAQYASISGKRPDQLTVADVATYQSQIQQIQKKVTRYGISTNSLAKAMVKNGPFWASMGSVYESSVIAANSSLQPGQTRYEAVYPKATFSSNMRAIVATAPWINPDEKAAAEKVIAFFQSPETQQIATSLGLRPGVPGVPPGPKFTADYGVSTQPTYDSYRPPQPEVVNAMLKSWREVTKKPSQVVLVVDTSGSMQGNKIIAMQNTLKTYIENLGDKEKTVLVRFSSDIGEPVFIDGTPSGREKGLAFVSSLQAQGGTRLYDASLYARNWLQQNLRPDAINAVVVLTDGEDQGSQITLDQLGRELKKTGFQSEDAPRIAVFTIGYGGEGEFDPQALKTIADFNGGYYSKGDPATIERVLSDLQVEF